MLNQRFDQLLSFLNDLTKTELFTNLSYVSYIEKSDYERSNEEKENFKVMDEFKTCINSFELTNKKLKILEQEFLTYKENLDGLIKEYNLK